MAQVQQMQPRQKKNIELAPDSLNSITSITYPGVLDGTIMTSDFNRHNIIYGWNASGKSSICRILRSIETGRIEANVKLQLKSSDSHNNLVTITEKSASQHTIKIKVFNADFVKECLRFEDDTRRIKGIVRIGTTEIDYHKRLKKLRKHLTIQIPKTENLMKGIKRVDDSIDDFYQTVSKEIRALAGLPQSYNKNSASDGISQHIQNLEHILLDDVIEKKSHLAKSTEQKSVVESITFSYSTELEKFVAEAARIIEFATLPTMLIESLINSPAMEKWVHDGITLHAEKTECHFCGGELTADRKRAFSLHFTNEVEQFKNEIQAIRASLSSFISSKTQLPDTGDFYSDEIEEWRNTTSPLKQIEADKEEIASQLMDAINTKESKSLYVGLMPSEVYLEKSGFKRRILEDLVQRIESLNIAMNKLIANHNLRVNEQANLKNEAIRLVKNHVFESNLPKLTKLKNERLRYVKRLNKRNAFSDSLQKEINQIGKLIEGIHFAADRINTRLTDFFGHSRIQVTTKNIGGVESYQITRDGKPADNLCEGEKNGIALIYFIESLDSNISQLSDSVIVMDDPISSYDSSNMFNAMSFISTYLGSAKQLIMFTHNYTVFCEFRKFFKPWKGQPTKAIFEIVRRDGHSTITAASKVLQKYFTEYEFLFAELKNFDSSKTYHDSYYLLNVARKVLEVFLTFKQGSSEGMTDSTRTLLSNAAKQNGLTDTEWKAVQDLINVGSHANLDFASSKSFFLAEHISDAVSGTLKIIEKIDPDHFKAMGTQAA